MTFSLGNYLEGMSLQVFTPDNGTSTLVWTPKADQVGTHTFVVYVTDGIDEMNISVTIQVLKAQIDDEGEGEDSISPLVFILPGIGLLIIIIFAVLLFIFLRRKKKEEPEEAEGKEAVEEDVGERPTTPEIPPLQPEMESGILPEPEKAPIEGTDSAEPPAAAPTEEIAPAPPSQPPEPQAAQTEQQVSHAPPGQGEGVLDTEPEKAPDHELE